jgi:tetratricopeptide (TPR) repeat protein
MPIAAKIDRHFIAVGVAIALAVALGVWIGSRTHPSAPEARDHDSGVQELDRARKERARAERVADLAIGLFRLDDPLNERGVDITARELLDQAVYDATASLAKDPDVQSQVIYLAARAYLNLGLLNSANRAAQVALDARRRLYGADDPRTLESTAQLGWILARQGQGTAAQRMERDTLERQLRVHGADSEQTLETMQQLAVIDRTLGDHEEEQKLLQQVAAMRARRLDTKAKTP